jgi:hypothetical protein
MCVSGDLLNGHAERDPLHHQAFCMDLLWDLRNQIT